MFPDMVIENKPTSDLILQYLNNAVNKFVTTRFTGLNYKQLGFEQDQKRIDDLRALVREVNYTFDEYDLPDVDGIEFPEDYMHLLGETAKIYSNDKCWPIDNEGNPIRKETDVLEATVENFDRQRENTLSEYRLRANKARPLRLIRGNHVYLYTDGNYFVDSYRMTYLKKPAILTLNSPMVEYELPDDVMKEIINLAVSTYLADKGDNRYNAAINEASSME